ncbi:TcfC E-set like domain-containing protein [uncultured Sphingomonas sp.]|uniref:TcfC E-set like domain-containing protein n=1 Tax=uncultured Sphingomonas sp. TaxID=158754 RepID=UPI0035CBF591
MKRRTAGAALWLAASLLGVGTTPATGAPAATVAHAPPPSVEHVAAAMPAEFAALAETRHSVVDAFFGDRRIGQFQIEATPDTVHLIEPAAMIAAVPDLIDRPAVIAALTGPKPANARYICNPSEPVCDRPHPLVATLVYDAARFRIDLIVNPRLLRVNGAASARFLEPGPAAPSLVDTVSFAIAGGDGQRTAYNLRNRFVAGAGNARLIAEVSASSAQALDVETLGVQLDRPNVRYAAGLFYAPGADLVGRRRILGVGIGSQFDTRLDRTALMGSPIIVFLTQRSRVDLYVEGRLATSKTFESGNQQLDTSGLPDGSYAVELRIQDATGATRHEQRFFTKSASLAPVGRFIFHAEAGMIAATRNHAPFVVSRVPLATAGVAGRYGAHLAWDAAAMATDRTALAEIGVSAITSAVQARVAILGSSAGDRGAAVQLSSAASGRLNYSFDLRQVRSKRENGLIPLDTDAAGRFARSGQAQRLGTTAADYTQLIGNLSYRLASAQISATGYYSRGASGRSSYAVGPAVRWSIIHRDRMQMSFNGSYVRTDRGPATSFGLQLQVLNPRASFSASVGAKTTNRPGDRSIGDYVELGASVQRENVLGGDLNAAAVVQHGEDGLVLQASADERGAPGFFTASLVERVGGRTAGTQFGLAGQTIIGWSKGMVSIGARDQADSVIAVALRSPAPGAKFEVLVDDAVRGTVTANRRLVIAVPPYRRYKVRLRAIGGDLLAFDTRTRTVDVLPGSFARLDWRAQPVVAMFGRLVGRDGMPVADADIVTDGAIAATDSRGYFQLQAARDAVLKVHARGGVDCTATVNAGTAQQSYVPLGDVPCRG